MEQLTNKNELIISPILFHGGRHGEEELKIQRRGSSPVVNAIYSSEMYQEATRYAEGQVWASRAKGENAAIYPIRIEARDVLDYTKQYDKEVVQRVRNAIANTPSTKEELTDYGQLSVSSDEDTSRQKKALSELDKLIKIGSPVSGRVLVLSSVYNPDSLRRALLKAGFDATKEGQEWAILDPNKIRSAVGEGAPDWQDYRTHYK